MEDESSEEGRAKLAVRPRWVYLWLEIAPRLPQWRTDVTYLPGVYGSIEQRSNSAEDFQ